MYTVMIKGNKMQFIHQSSSTYTKKSITPYQSTTLWSKDHMLVVKSDTNLSFLDRRRTCISCEPYHHNLEC